MKDVFDTIERRGVVTSTPLVLRLVSRDAIRAYALPRSSACVIGRAPEVDAPIDDVSVSRRHVRLSALPDAVEIEDLGSKNGTVTARGVLAAQQPAHVAVDEIFTVGDVSAVVHEGGLDARATSGVGAELLWQTLEATIRVAEHAAAAMTDSVHGSAAVCVLRGVDVAVPLDAVVALAPPRAHVLACATSVVVVVVPEMRRPAAAHFIDAVKRHVQRLGIDSTATVRMYPEDAKTVDDLWPDGLVVESGASVEDEDARTMTVRGNEAMREVEQLVAQVAPTPASVLIMGETGVGKEVCARAIHQRSGRGGAFVALNCAALPETLLESELFGHEKGAFTGAHASKQGLIEASSGGTLFLDELGEMPLTTQAKLLRVLEERAVMRVGSVKPREVDMRLVAATNRDLLEEIEAKRFRADLYYRLNGFIVRLPPLRDRVEEIPLLVSTFAARAAATFGCAAPRFSNEMLALLARYPWPGNVRELRNAVERVTLLAKGGFVLQSHLPEEIRRAIDAPPAARPLPMEQTVGPAIVQRDHMVTMPPGASLDDEMAELDKAKVLEALDKCAGNQTRAAELLGITRRALIVRMDKYNLPRPRRS